MRKRTLLPALLSAIMVTAFSVPAITAAFAEGPAATTEKTKIVEIFNGNAENVSLENKATATQDGETTVVSIPNDVPWSGGFILFKNPVDLTSAKEEGKLFLEYKAMGASWATVNAVTYAGSWKEPVSLNGSGESLGVSPDYTVKSYSLSALTEAQLTKFYGFSLKPGQGASFYVKRVWVEYPNPDYVEGGGTTAEGVYQLVTEPVASTPSVAGYTHGVNILSSYSVKSGDKIKAAYTVSTTNKAIDVLIGGNKLPAGIWATSEKGIYEYTFTEGYSGNIVFGAWSTEFTVNSLELTIYGSGAETKKINFYDENGGVIESLSGVEYDLTKENVLPDYSVENKLFIGWDTGNGIYPAGGAFDAAATDSVTALAIDFKTSGEAYFRIGETADFSGIRFDTAFSAQDYAKIAKIVTEYGTLILPKDTLNGKEISLENFVADETVLKVKSTYSYTTDGVTVYRGAIFGVKEANYNRAFAARGYLTVKYSDGTVKNFYSSVTAERSVAYMAKTLMENPNGEYELLTEEQKAIVSAYAAAYQA